jgi:hypothetical protein
MLKLQVATQIFGREVQRLSGTISARKSFKPNTTMKTASTPCRRRRRIEFANLPTLPCPNGHSSSPTHSFVRPTVDTAGAADLSPRLSGAHLPLLGVARPHRSHRAESRELRALVYQVTNQFFHHGALSHFKRSM